MRELIPWLRLIFRRPKRLALGAVLILLTLLSGIGLLALSGWFIAETALVGLLLAAGIQATINLYTPGGGIRFFAVARTVTRYLERVYNHDTVLRLLTDIRVALFERLALAPRLNRSGLTGAQWLSRLTSDVDALDTVYLRVIAPTALALAVTLLVLLGSALVFGVGPAAWLAIPLASAFLLSTVGTYWRTRQLAGRQSDRIEHLRSDVIEHLEGFAELTAAGRTGKHASRLLRQGLEANTDQARSDRRAGWHQAVSGLLINLSAVAALGFGLAIYQHQLISGPVLVMMPIVLLGLGEVYGMLPDAFGRLGATQASAARLNNLTSTELHRPEKHASSLPESTALLASDISLRHEHLPPILTHFSLQVSTGDRLGIIGHSGSGKSTLADAFAGLITPSHGELSAASCCYLTQQTVIFDDTLRANLLIGNPGANDTDLWRVLEALDLAGRFAESPEQLDTWLGSSGSRLSGGEARRIALARVLINPAPLLLLDEPFTGVDQKTASRISERMTPWLEGRTMIGFAHTSDALPGVQHLIHLAP
ncbi:MAG: thiol reductant ABC exporter subunit CydC [Gammaproteobacteria bacterium]|nr:MAG: thiol reductant ABC exporter subunit CydC [Gammaproteobacteria bacterium]